MLYRKYSETTELKKIKKLVLGQYFGSSSCMKQSIFRAGTLKSLMPQEQKLQTCTCINMYICMHILEKKYEKNTCCFHLDLPWKEH